MDLCTCRWGDFRRIFEVFDGLGVVGEPFRKVEFTRIVINSQFVRVDDVAGGFLDRLCELVGDSLDRESKRASQPAVDLQGFIICESDGLIMLTN